MRWEGRRGSSNGEDRRGMSTRGIAVAYVIAHEVGHHVQNLVGTLDQVNQQRAKLSERRANQLTVSLELQADFLAGMWAHHAQGDTTRGVWVMSTLKLLFDIWMKLT